MKKKRKPNGTSKRTDAEKTGDAIQPAPFSHQDMVEGLTLPPDEVCTDPIRFTTLLSVICKPEISRHYYMGDDLLQVNENTPPAELLAMGMDLDDDEKDGVLPGLKAHITTLVGESLLPFVFCEIGQDSVSLSWAIYCEVFEVTAKRVLSWIKYAELEDIITVEEGRLW